MEKKEITAVDYDGLLKIFLSEDDFRQALQQPNTVNDKTYATDAHAVIVIPNNLLRGQYGTHPKVPDFKPVFEAIKECTPEVYKDTDLFKALQVHPKVHDTEECDQCDGTGRCPHCRHECDDCDGKGTVKADWLPMVYDSEAVIEIGEQGFSPYQLGRLEKVVVETFAEQFTLVGRSNMAALFRIGEVEVLICRLHLDKDDDWPTTVLAPIQKHTVRS